MGTPEELSLALAPLRVGDERIAFRRGSDRHPACSSMRVNGSATALGIVPASCVARRRRTRARPRSMPRPTRRSQRGCRVSRHANDPGGSPTMVADPSAAGVDWSGRAIGRASRGRDASSRDSDGDEAQALAESTTTVFVTDDCTLQRMIALCIGRHACRENMRIVLRGICQQRCGHVASSFVRRTVCSVAVEHRRRRVGGLSPPRRLCVSNRTPPAHTVHATLGLAAADYGIHRMRSQRQSAPPCMPDKGQGKKATARIRRLGARALLSRGQAGTRSITSTYPPGPTATTRPGKA
ncbi:hypothetical protein DCS_05654 [Drechmeria coniospora]|uniref:Uncharacterized protein n=1 Tax=Drechmeria coniospora TaxID=98403 RepID=A0A151GNE2_DRECN|nr:hypothetical protein DCS_05654 [Drechmeria coniospora]KYK58637.1 hypothetical protein DCS_05654 [Drechmeria coniospora]